VPTSREAFDQVVRQGALVSQGMPSFSELSDVEFEDIRTYIRTETDAWRKSRKASAASVRR
jgi:quinohemoprotein ethanol dehydrogenase